MTQQRNFIRISGTCLLFFISTLSIFAQQPGSLDMTFNPSDNIAVLDIWASNESMVLQPDGKIIIADRRLKRLNSDGTLDPTFFWSNNFIPGSILCMELQTDGKIIIAGTITDYYGSPRRSIARLNTDGTIDPTFQIGSGFDSGILALSIQPDGKILVGGAFKTFNGDSTGSVVRLNTDGSIDTTFNSIKLSSSFGYPTVHALKVQSDGRVITGGYFDYLGVNGNTIYNLIRFESDGSTDTSFVHGNGTGEIRSILIQPDNKILLAGTVSQYNSTNLPRGVLRLEMDGTLDTTFMHTGPGISSGHIIYKIILQADGKIVAVGTFSEFDTIPSEHIMRLNADGTYDPGFDVGTGFNGYAKDLYLQPDGNILVLGEFSAYNFYGCRYMVRLLPNGDRDLSFRETSGFNSDVQALSILPSNRILAGGYFTSFNNRGIFASAILHADGSLDTTYTQLYTGIGTVSSQAVQIDGKFVLKGGINTPNSGHTITRTMPDGSIDTSFHGIYSSSGYGIPSTVNIQESDQKILAEYGGGRFYRLNPDGSSDSAFSDIQSFDDWIWAIKAQEDGKIFLGGDFTTVQGLSYNKIVRLMPNGSVDTTFNPPGGVTGSTVRCVTVQDDGKYIIGGDFTHVNGQSQKNIARLNSNGSLDTTFTDGTGFNGPVYSLLIQPDGKIIAGGDFYYYNLIQSIGIARLNSSGSLDLTFQTGTGFTGGYGAQALAFAHDWKIIAGGGFTSYNGTVRNNILRLHGTSLTCNTPPTGIQLSVPGNQICLGDSVTLYRVGGVTAPGGSFKWYSGSCGATLVGTGDSITVAPTTNTLYTLRAESSCGNSPCAIKTVYIKPNTNFITGSTAVCSNDTITLYAAGNWDTFQWSTGATTPTLQVTTPGVYTLTVNSTMPVCSGTDSWTVIPAPASSVQITGNTVICGSTAVILDPGNYSSYHWSTGITTQTLTTLIPGTYAVTVTDLYGCTGTDSVIVTAGTAPIVNITAMGSTSFCQGDSVQLSATPGFVSWQWYRFSSMIVPSNSPNIYAKTRGSYYCIATDSAGCSDMSNVIFIQVPCIHPIHPAQQKSMVSDEVVNSIDVYPNPATGTFRIEVICDAEFSVPRMFHISGKEVSPEISESSKGVFIVNNVTPGMYFIMTTCGQSEHYTRFIQLE